MQVQICGSQGVSFMWAKREDDCKCHILTLLGPAHTFARTTAKASNCMSVEVAAGILSSKQNVCNQASSLEISFYFMLILPCAKTCLMYGFPEWQLDRLFPGADAAEELCWLPK